MSVLVFLTVSAEPGQAERVHALLRELPEVIESCMVEDGPYDIVALVSVGAFESYREFAVDKMGSIPHIEDYTSFITVSE